MSRILVINSGSSSLKYRLFDADVTIVSGTVERIGEPGGQADDHASALAQVLTRLDAEVGKIAAIGHRVVHGGDRFSQPVLVNDAVVAAVTELISLAPLHNPANLAGIEVARRLLPQIPQVAVFDTAFHQTMPQSTATYAIEHTVAARLGIRRYGFHGTSHSYVARQAAALLGRPLEQLNLITLHLGNGASACAVSGGRSVATSMGLTPLEGLVMGTRSGDLDPAIIFHLYRVGGLTVDQIDDLLNHRSGLRGLCGANDMREVIARLDEGDAAAQLAFDVYCGRIKDYVGRYAFTLGRLDGIVFTAGVGENAPRVRQAALAGLSEFGIQIDERLNWQVGKERLISPTGAPVTVSVIPTDEELEIATQVRQLLSLGG